jgi:hypothetical protein
LIRQISDRSLPISFIMYLRFCSVMSSTAPTYLQMPFSKSTFHFTFFILVSV